MSFKDKVVIITGAGSGMGAAIATQYSNEGASVVLVDKDKAMLINVQAFCRDSLIIHADISNDIEVKRIIDETIAKYNKLDILVNNAGILRTGCLLDGAILNSYTQVMNVNLRAAIHLTSLAAPHLIKTKGSVVNISSCASHMSSISPSHTMYNVSKTALNSFTIFAASELASHGVRVNAISPGPVKTNLLENSELSITFDDLKRGTALNRISEPEEIADLVLFLTSDKAQAITGSNIVSDNGFILRN